MNYIGDLGLVIDIMGAIIIARSITANSDANIAASTGAWWDCNPYAAASLIGQKVDGLIGVAYLVLGFAGQFSASSGLIGDPQSTLYLAGVLGLVALIVDAKRESWIVEKTIAAVSRMEITGPLADMPILERKLRAYLRGDKSIRELSEPANDDPVQADGGDVLMRVA